MTTAMERFLCVDQRESGLPHHAKLQLFHAMLKLGKMRASEPPVRYLVGTPKGRLTKLEQSLAEQPWEKARDQVDVKHISNWNYRPNPRRR